MTTAAAAKGQDEAVEPEREDIESYISAFDEDGRQELAAAEAAIDIAILLHRARVNRGLSQAATAELAGLQQQAVSRFERPGTGPRLETLQSYLGALGYGSNSGRSMSQPARRPPRRSFPRSC